MFYLVLLKGHAQSESRTEKTLQTKSDRIELVFSEIDKIEIESSEKDLIEVVAVNHFGRFSGFTLEETGGIVHVISEMPIKSEEREFKSCGIQPDFSTYSVKIPNGKSVFLQVQEGNVEVHNFRGNLQLNLGKGFADFKNYSGKIQVQMNVGNINSDMNNSIFEVDTQLGNIFVDDLVVPKKNEAISWSGK
jgi:hypothetical protein